ncbi:MAG: HDOD domain-containing protein [Deltaproteobacteria bacterium]|nr:HDOD domain-containing protein [Deltaproteobacteria bacterium]
MEKDKLREKIYSKIDEIPTLPIVIPKLLTLMESDKSDAADVADVVSRDPALTSKILKVANSAYYGFSKGISSLEKAVPLLGFNMVQSLALSIGVLRSLPAGKKSTHFSQQDLWIHSLAVATVMKELGKRFGKGDDHEYLFIIGLLHDIGKIVLDQYFGELFHHAIEEFHNLGNIELHQVETREIGVDHGEVGAMLLTRWKFPDKICNAIAAHHLSKIPEGTNSDDVAMLRLADVLPQEINLGEGGSPIPPEIHDADLKILEMDEEQLKDIKAYLFDLKDGIYDFYRSMS